MRREWVRILAGSAAALSAAALLASCAMNPQKAKLEYLQKGEGYMKKSQYSSAAIEFRNALKIDPKYVDAYKQLTRAYIALKDGTDAYQTLNQAITAAPNDATLRLERAQLLLAGRQFDNAKQDIDFVLKQEPKNLQANRLLGSLYVAQKQYPQALEQFTKTASFAPNDATTYLDIALLNMQMRDSKAAEANFQKAVQVNPKSVAAYTDLANFYRLQNNPSKAEEVLQNGIKEAPQAIPLYVNLATVYASQKQAAQADGTLANLANALPHSADAAVAIGDFYLQQKMNPQALAQYQRGLSVDPKNLTLEERIEDLYLATQQTDKAAEMEQTLLKQAPHDVIVRIDQGRLLSEQGKTSEAVSELQKVAADEANSPQAHYYLAMAYLQDNNPSQANSELQQTLQLAPALPIALTALVNLNYSQGKYSVAQLYAQELEQHDPGNPSAHLLLGQVYLKLGQFNRASEQFSGAERRRGAREFCGSVHCAKAISTSGKGISDRDCRGAAERSYPQRLCEFPDGAEASGKSRCAGFQVRVAESQQSRRAFTDGTDVYGEQELWLRPVGAAKSAADKSQPGKRLSSDGADL